MSGVIVGMRAVIGSRDIGGVIVGMHANGCSIWKQKLY
jgi:hypothetical protein